ncbi:hypothetical protein QX233_05810 [Chryseobacterium gambrini]|uniref:PRTase-CE domain-containing protein n=1 Tax=Chryseobacterium gambrini TaxID=373672 RepID=A0AAJ1R2R6_9FLAO|nr:MULTISPECIES: hypothetical protein [Chryseobacterium]MDN4011965.1 hypothetical protein [Chryseobacterium gambrini]MDN4029320.1 hypothetical protein [Chryseobacterium gambrini]QWA40551.1 hypothetical protein KKI44_10245 [Chryseobacterium sp. ZHDP1]
MDERSKQLIIENLNYFKELETRLNTYQNAKIDVIRIIYFLTQFNSYKEIEMIIQLLKKFDYLDSKMITYLLKVAYNKIEEEHLVKPMLSSLGGIQDSSAVICYQLLKHLFDDENDILNKIINIENIGSNIESNIPSALILFDDNITSGTQLEAFFKELFVGSDEPEFFKQPLTSSQHEILKKIPIRICYAIQLSENSNQIIENIRNEYKIDLKVFCGKVDYINYLDYQSNIFLTIQDSDYTKEFISDISRKLFSDKNWSYEKVYNRVLGYGNLGKLTAFYYNVPKSLIPIFWKFGYYNNKPWFPLLPETQEAKKILESQEQFDFMKVDAIKNWISTGLSNRKPSLKFGVLSDKGIINEFTLSIPSRKIIHEKIINIIQIKKLKYIENTPNTDRSPLSFLNKKKHPKRTLSTTDYNRYKNEIDNYNISLENFLLNFEEYIYRLSSTNIIEFIIENEGNTPANNFNLKLFYNTGQIMFDDINDFLPEFKEVVPDIDDFYTKQPGEIYLETHLFQNSIVKNKTSNTPNDKIKPDSDYVYKMQENRLGHNDAYRNRINLIRVDSTLDKIEVPYELNFDEESDTISGQLTINYIEVDEVNPENSQELLKSINKFNDLFLIKQYGR